MSCPQLLLKPIDTWGPSYSSARCRNQRQSARDEEVRAARTRQTVIEDARRQRSGIPLASVNVNAVAVYCQPSRQIGDVGFTAPARAGSTLS